MMKKFPELSSKFVKHSSPCKMFKDASLVEGRNHVEATKSAFAMCFEEDDVYLFRKIMSVG